MAIRLQSCDCCLIRNILFGDHFKGGLVSHRVFRDTRSVDGLSLTETRDVIKGLDDLQDYRNEASKGMKFLLGTAVFPSDLAATAGLTWKSDPHNQHKFGFLHVLGPTHNNITDDLRRELARLSNLSGWSCGISDLL